MSRLTLRSIEIFIAAVEEGSVAAAARRLKTSPSSISQQISNLESELGTILLDRAARPLALTPSGFLFQRRAQNILAEAILARAELSAQDFSKLSRFSIAIIDDFEPDVTPALISQLSEDMPQAHLVLSTGASHSNLAALESRSVDICIAAEPDSSADWMEIYPLLNEPFVALAPKGKIDPAQDSFAQLMQLPFIRFPENQVVGRKIEAALAHQRLSIPQKFTLDSYQSIMAMVAKGAGWAIAPPMCYLRAQRFQDSVDMMPIPINGLSRRISLFARRDTLDVMPRDIATRMRPLIKAMLIDRAIAQFGWLRSEFRLL
ncbi:MAG: LysR family transcriptional regulator [Rhodobacteraceae bacterium]|nr:LysR family transcriptional regulator [Paracoccaceae bacterium]